MPFFAFFFTAVRLKLLEKKRQASPRTDYKKKVGKN
jgi:hypothetical protein